MDFRLLYIVTFVSIYITSGLLVSPHVYDMLLQYYHPTISLVASIGLYISVSLPVIIFIDRFLPVVINKTVGSVAALASFVVGGFLWIRYAGAPDPEIDIDDIEYDVIEEDEDEDEVLQEYDDEWQVTDAGVVVDEEIQ